MLDSITGLLKLWIVFKAFSNPVVWIGCLALFTALLLVSAMFIRFKNGWISVVCFILLEALGILAVLSLNSGQSVDDLHLDKGTVVSCVDVTPDGVVIKKRFRTTTVSLLGLKLPENESVYFSSAKEYIQNACASGNLYMHYSSVYKGAVFCDSNFTSLNEELLKQGLARADIAAPKQYIRLQKEAVKYKRGMWEIASYTPTNTSILRYSVNWLIFINSVCMAAVATTWIKRLVIKNKFQVSSLIGRR